MSFFTRSYLSLRGVSGPEKMCGLDRGTREEGQKGPVGVCETQSRVRRVKGRRRTRNSPFVSGGRGGPLRGPRVPMSEGEDTKMVAVGQRTSVPRTPMCLKKRYMDLCMVLTETSHPKTHKK